jgi:hypothetical protein
VPVWQAWYERLVRIGRVASEGATDRVWDSGLGYMARGVPAAAVDDQVRVSFYRAFGILPDLQEDLEAEYSGSVSLAPAAPMTFPDVASIDRALNPLATWLSASR